MLGDAAIIEVGTNESVMRTQHPNVPYSPLECAADANRCADAGAAVVHWHARDPHTGAPRLGEAALYGDALAAMRREDLLAYPTYPVDVRSVEERLGHCWALRATHGLELAPVDVGSVTIVLWDTNTRQLAPTVEFLRAFGVVENPLPFTLDALARIGELGMVASIGAFDVGATRTAVLLAESGLLAPPIFLKIFLSEAWAVGPFPTEAAIDFHLAQLPAGLDVEWVVVPYTISDPALVERLCRHALERGGGIRVGIGDNPDAYPHATNAALVERAAEWVTDAGRAVASAADVRARLGLPA